MIYLHVHTNFSLLRGSIGIDELIKTCKKKNIKTIALTDTDAMNGLIKFAKKVKENDIQSILGACITEPDDNKKYVVLLAKNIQGYSDLCRIITQRKLNEDFSLAKIVAEIWENLFLITPIISLLEAANKKNSLYAELIPTKANKKHSLKTYQFAIENNIPFVASNPVYFMDREDFDLHKLVTAIRLNKTLDSVSSDELVDEEFYLKDQAEIEKIFFKIPDAIENTHKIADKCIVDLKLGEHKYPQYIDVQMKSSFELLRTITFKGLSKRFESIDDKIKNRLDYELNVIKELSFVDYFLIVWDIVQEAKRRGMITIGRGSAANSLVAYCLELTQVDPIKLNLYFERFLNKARTSPPDVDIDFSWKERDEIVKYIFEKYGYERVAMISTTVTFRARSAFRETAKAFGISDREISKFRKKIPWTNAVNLPKISEMFPESRSLGFDKEPWKTIVNLASRISNFPRHLSIHPSGIVITPTKITDYCALEYAKNKGLGLIITQPDMYSIEDLGLVKIDLLSQRSLGVLRDTLNTINEN
ncbi:MAG: PHP domain-containing protein [Ignavibacterium sp.]|jgi:DNA polymerase III alpha subunit|nr:PHP domain-containing protein [Ignavibacterium sp.]